jgi:uncharacterized protein
MIRLTLALTLTLVAQALAQHTVESIPNNRLVNDSRVSDPDGVLTREGTAELDSILVDIENQTSAQVALVVVKSIGDASDFDFSQQLFNTWGIGHENDNGLLVLLVVDQRTVRFHTGTGLEGVLTDVTCKRIQRDYMIPSFKEGDYEAGLIAGISRVREYLTDPTSREEIEYSGDDNVISDYAAWMIFLAMFYFLPLMVILVIKSVNGSFANSKKSSRTPYKEMRRNKAAWLVEFGLIPFLIAVAFWTGPADAAGWSFIALYFYFMLTLVRRLFRERKVLKRLVDNAMYFEATEFIRSTQWYWFVMALLFPPFLFYFFFHLSRKSHYRNHPRNCKTCNAPMRKLNERDDDQYLTEKQRFEEQLRSVDYDVWLCSSCQSTSEWAYMSRRRKYEVCPSCKTRARYVKSRQTVTSASYTSSGQGKETQECKFCKETFVSTYTIAKLVASTSGSSSSSGSSSGSSWGGGRSSGGGASSSW